MVVGIILAGGVGQRANQAVPKQFVQVCGKSILMYTLMQVIAVERIERVIVCTHSDWIENLNKEIDESFSLTEKKRLMLCEGGKTRNGSILNGLKALEAVTAVSDDDIVMVHDGARPLVSTRILEDSIQSVEQFGATVPLYPTGTVYTSSDGKMVDGTPDREVLFAGQSPESYKYWQLKEMFESITEDEMLNVHSLVQVALERGHNVHGIQGDALNFKITTESDIVIARALIEDMVLKKTRKI